MEFTKNSLKAGIDKAEIGNKLGQISAAIQQVAEAQGYGVVRQLVGHGAARRKECRFHTQQICYACLELQNGGVVPENIVPDSGIHHSLTHAWYGPRYGITAEIDRHDARSDLLCSRNRSIDLRE